MYYNYNFLRQKFEDSINSTNKILNDFQFHFQEDDIRWSSKRQACIRECRVGRRQWAEKAVDRENSQAISPPCLLL